MAETLRIGIVGTGYFSQFHYEAWQRLERTELVGLAARTESHGRARAEAYGVKQVFGSVAALLDGLEIDLLDIITPPETHLEMVSAAAAHGVPVICQKPLAPTLAEAEEVVRIAEAAGIMLAVHENFRFQPWYLHARAMIDQGRLGALHGIDFRLRPGDGQGPDAYLARQPYFQEMPRFLIHETGIHFVDTFRSLLGEVTAVTARLRRINPAIAGEDAGTVLFEFADGTTGLFDGNRLNDHSAENCRLTMGEMHLEGSNGVLRLDGEGRLWWKPHGAAEQEERYDWSREGFAGDCVYALQRHVVEHLLDDAPLVNSGRDYLTNVRIEEAIYQSHESGQRITL